MSSKSVAILLVLQLVFALVHGDSDVDYLYGDNHYPVKEYTGGNDIFETSDLPRIVEFYSPHCPACIAFKPEYMKLARDTRLKHKEVSFVAVSCDHHEDVCNKFGIDDYPTMYAFPAGEDGKRVPHGSYTPTVLATKLKLSAAPSTSVKLRRRMDEKNGEDDDTANNGGNGDDDDAASNGGNGDDDAASNGGNGDDDATQNASGNGDDDATQNASGNGDDDTTQNASGNGDDDATQNASGNGDDDATQNASGNGDDDTTQNASGNGDDDATQNASGNGDDDATQNASGNGDDDATQNASGNGDDDATQNASGNGDDDATQNASGNGDDDATQNGSGNGDDDTTQNGSGNGDDDAVQNNGSNGDDDAASGNGDDDDNTTPGSIPGIPMTPQVVRMEGDRRPGAGAIRARNSYKDMDRFQEEIKARKKEYDKKRKGVGKLLRKDERKDKKGKPKERMHPDAMTKTMRVHTPGTTEYNERKEKVLKRIKKAKKEAPPVLKKEALPFKKDVRPETFVRKQAERLPIVRRFVKMTPEEQLILDVSVSLVAALETGTFVGVEDTELSREKKNALKDFLDLLNISLPPEWGIHKLIDDLRRRIAFVAQNSKNLRYVISQNPLPRRGWSDSCTHGVRRSSGYSCGLWKLFHVATVGVAEHRGGLNLIESGMIGESTKTFSPIEAADAIKNFIEHFFSCKSCREHFVEQYNDCDNNRRCDRLSEELEDAATADWKELPIWLWEVHNEVSIHILHQKIQKESQMSLMGNARASRRATPTEEVSALWPNVETCVMCFEDDGTWDEPEIFKFLERNYWPDAELDPKSDRLIQFEGESSFFSVLMMWTVVLMIVYAIYNVVMKNSTAISQSVVMARRVVQTTGVKVAPRKKERTN